MAIARPITKTIISTTAWGIPVTDAINANATDIAALKPGAWTNATLSNGWTYYLQQAQYRKIGDMVYLRGFVVSPGTAISTIATLPVGFRPPLQCQFPSNAWLSGYYLNAINVNSDGRIEPNSTLPGASTSLPIFNISFSTI